MDTWVMKFSATYCRLMTLTVLFVAWHSSHLTDAFLSWNMVENPIIPECDHLIIAGDQVNSYIADEGQRCCMCPIGTYVADECKVTDPNSTRCDGCEYDAGKQTYVNYGPHNLDSCFKDIVSCSSPMIKIRGSQTSPSRCVCPDGYTLVERHRCIRASLMPVITGQRTNPIEQNSTTVTPALPLSTKIIDQSSTTAPQDITQNATASGTTTAMFVLAAFLGFLLAFVVAIGYICVVKRGWLRDILTTCERDQDRNLASVGVVPPMEEKPIQPGDEIIEMNAKTIELLQTSNNAVRYIANEQGEENAHLILPQNLQSLPPTRSQNEDNAQENRPAIAKRISQREISLRFEIFMEWAEIIHAEHLCSVGRQLLQKQKNAFDDIYYNDRIRGRAEKARKILLLAIDIDSQLCLEDIKNLVEGLDYLCQIVEDKIEKLKTDGDVD